MPFIILTFAAALVLEVLGSLISVIGFSSFFNANKIIIAFAISLDIAKIVVVSLVYNYWGSMSLKMRSYAIPGILGTMLITSGGAAGYFSGEFEKAMLGTREGSLKVSVLKEQQSKYEERKRQIDDQIANLPPTTTVNQRLKLMNGFKQEQRALDAKISEIDKKLPELQITQIGTEAKAGPILSIAKAFNIPPEEAVKWVIALLIFVFDPMAVFLTVAGNFLIEQRRLKIDRTSAPKVIVNVGEDPPAPEKEEKAVVKPELEQEFKLNVEQNGESYDVLQTSEPKAEPVREERSIIIEEGYSLPPAPPVEEPEPIPVEEPKETNVVRPELSFREPDNSEVKPLREQITKSSLGAVVADPSTTVDAGRHVGYRPAKLLKTTK